MLLMYKQSINHQKITHNSAAKGLYAKFVIVYLFSISISPCCYVDRNPLKPGQRCAKMRQLVEESEEVIL